MAAPQPLIWIIGYRGMLGSEAVRLLTARGLDFVSTDSEVDITDKASLEQFAAEHDFTHIVNCAAWTAVDAAEDDAERCRRLNALGPGLMGEVAEKKGASVVHISTDYVFDGTEKRPYRENDATAPTGVYGATKLAGEKALFAACSRAYVVRTAWLYGAFGKNFVTTMLHLMKERDKVTVVSDQWGSPTWARDLAEVIVDLIVKGEVPYGVYHYSGGGECSWFDFAQAIYERGKKCGLVTRDCEVLPCTTAEYPTRTARPAYSVLDKGKIRAALGITVPRWEDSLDAFFGEGGIWVR